jgi:hypothetical protein
MNKVQFLLASEPREPLKPRSLHVILLIEKDVCIKRRRTCDYHPVLCVITYDNDEDAIRIANDTSYGLHAYVNGTDA